MKANYPPDVEVIKETEQKFLPVILSRNPSRLSFGATFLLSSLSMSLLFDRTIPVERKQEKGKGMELVVKVGKRE